MSIMEFGGNRAGIIKIRRNDMRNKITSKEAKQKHNALPSCWSSESQLSQKVLISVLWHLEKQTELLSQLVKVMRHSKIKRPLTPYMRFFGKKAKEGKSAFEIAKLWKLQSKP